MRLTLALAVTSMMALSTAAFAQSANTPGMNGNGLDSTGNMPARDADLPSSNRACTKVAPPPQIMAVAPEMRRTDLATQTPETTAAKPIPFNAAAA